MFPLCNRQEQSIQTGPVNRNAAPLFCDLLGCFAALFSGKGKLGMWTYASVGDPKRGAVNQVRVAFELYRYVRFSRFVAA